MSHRPAPPAALPLAGRLRLAALTSACVALLALTGCGEGEPTASAAPAPSADAPAQAKAAPAVAPAPVVRPAGPMQPRPPLPKARPAPTGTFFGLGPIQADKDKRKHPFYIGPKPPPRTGEVVELTVPPPGPAPGSRPTVAAPAAGLKVARVAPNGRVGLVNALTAQFNQPMVPVGSLSDLRRWPVPLQVTPAVDAKARWLGTQTVALESAKRLPYSTRYTATVPAGTRSASGQTLAKAHTWTFETPRLHLRRRTPSGKQVRPEAVVVLGFDQDVRPDAVARAVRLTHKGDRIRLAAVPAKAWKTLPRVGSSLASANPKRTVVLRPVELLPVDSAFQVTLPAGSYSTEGPRPTEKALSWGFRTYPPLRIDRGYCEWRDKRKNCREGNAISVRTTTSLAAGQDLNQLVTVTPKPDDLQVRVSGRGLSITGAFQASSRYQVTIAKGLRDVFGQTTRRRWRETFSYRDGEPVLQLASTRPVVLERAGRATLNARVRNLKEVTLHLMRVGPEGLAQAHRGFGSRWYPREKHPMDRLVGSNRSSRSVRTRVAKNKLGITALDLSPALKGRKSGVVAVSVEAPWPYDKGWFSSKDAYASVLVQVTGVGITARWDDQRVVAYVASLETGAPLAHAAVQLIDGKGGTLQRGTTDARGVVELPCKSWSYRESRYLWASVGEGADADTAFLALGRRMRGAGAETLRSFVWTDRDPYKPGEQAHLTGMLRTIDPARLGGVKAVTDAEQVKWTLYSARGHKLSKGESQVDADGGFYVQLDLPDDMDLGSTRFDGRVVGGRWNGRRINKRFQVQHYRTPEFKVAAAIKPGAVAQGAQAAGGSAADLALRFGAEAALEVSGRYYFGAPMAGAKAHYVLRRTTTRYRPPGHGGWTFGRVPVHAWRSSRHFGRHRGSSGAVLAQGQGTLDGDGRWQIPHLLDATLRDSKGAPVVHKGKAQRLQGPASYKLETWVEDDARQRISARTAVTVHQGTTYAGLKLARTVLKVGQKLALSVVAADVAGKRQARKVQVRLLRLVPDKKGRWSHAPSFRRGGYGGAMPWLPRGYAEVEAGRCTAATTLTPGKDGKPAPASCAFVLSDAGHYRVRAQVKDDQGATTLSEIDAYAHGPKRVRWSVHDVSKVELVADKPTYEPGDTATVLVKSPFPAARGLLSVARNGLVSWQILDVPNGAEAVKIPIDPRWVPGAHVQVTLFSGRSGKPGKPGRRGALDPEAKPRTATGQLVLKVARSAKRITVDIAAAQPVATPGATVKVQVKTTDQTGAPVASHVTLWAVDEGVLALLGYATPDPLSFFHTARSALTAGDDLRARILVERFKKVVGTRRPQPRKRRQRKGGGMGSIERVRATSGAAFGKRRKLSARPRPAAPPMAKAEADSAPADEAEEAPGGGGPAPTLRQLFAATAFFHSRVKVDGTGTVEVKLPDNATTFRLMAVADAGVDRFGSGDGQLTTRQPVLLRAALPRFANLHDDFDAAAVLHNETGAPQTFVVGARGTGVSWHDTFTKTVTLDAGASTEVRFRVRATQTGRATFQFAARVQGSKRVDYADAVQRSIPVNLPATLEAFATYGSTTSSVKQPIQAPLDAIPDFGGLDVTLSSTALSGLEDATRYLLEYPYECAEQTASRLIPIAVLGELLDQFQIGTFQARAKREALVKRAVKRLVGLQHWDGGFKFWPKSRRSSRWVSPWVTYALLLAREQGADVPANALRKANNYLRNQVRRSSWSQGWWRVSDVLSLWVLTHKANPNRVSKGSLDRPFNRLYRERAKLPMFAKAWLMTVAHRRGATTERDALLREIDNAVVEKAGTAHIAEGKSEDLRILMHSSDRTDAVVLGALVEVQPAHATVGKLIRGLMEARVKGRWSTTQANAWALVTARRYFDVFEKVKPDFQTQLWLGQGYLGTQTFKGRSLAKAHAHVPMAMVLDRAQREGRAAPQAQGKQAKGQASGKPQAAGKVVDLVLARKGAGRMYYRLGMRYAPKSLRLPAEEQGFTVQRRYEALNPKDKHHVQQLPDGTWRVRAGTDVRVQLTVVVPTRGHYVVVDDPLPAGFEAQNPAFRTTSSGHRHVRQRRGGGWRWYSWWRWDHIEMRDDRVLLFADRLWSGVYSHSYVARATSVGRFVVPPARAEEMYAPETFGRNATTFVEVVP